MGARTAPGLGLQSLSTRPPLPGLDRNRCPGARTPTEAICGWPGTRPAIRSSGSTGALGNTPTRRSTSSPSTPRPRALVAGALSQHEPVRRPGPCPRRAHPANPARRHPARGPRRPYQGARRTPRSRSTRRPVQATARRSRRPPSRPRTNQDVDPMPLLWKWFPSTSLSRSQSSLQGDAGGDAFTDRLPPDLQTFSNPHTCSHQCLKVRPRGTNGCPPHYRGRLAAHSVPRLESPGQ